MENTFIAQSFNNRQRLEEVIIKEHVIHINSIVKHNYHVESISDSEMVVLQILYFL